MKKLSNMDDDELLGEWSKAADALEEAKKKVKEFAKEHNERLTKAAAQARYDAMNDTERAALAQLFEVEGIESQEAVNNG